MRHGFVAILLLGFVFSGAGRALAASDFLADRAEFPEPVGLTELCKSAVTGVTINPACSHAWNSDMPLKQDSFVVGFFNRRVNTMMTYVSDLARYNTADRWVNPEKETSGDCEEMALSKQMQLLQQGFRAASLRLTLIMDDRRRYAVVLSYTAADGDYILDYRNNDLLKWNQTGYYFVARQSATDQRQWQSLNWVKGGEKSHAKDLLSRPTGQDWNGCASYLGAIPEDVFAATTPPPAETAEQVLPTQQDYRRAAQSFQKKWPGYRPISKIKDKAVADWSKRVFRIYSFGERAKGELPTVVDLKNPKNTIKGNKKIARSTRDFQVETCKRQKLSKCPVFSQLTTGTAFRVGKDTYYTCRHNPETWLTWASDLNGIPQEKIIPPMALTDEKYGSISRFIYYSARPQKMMYKPKLFLAEPKVKSDREESPVVYKSESYFGRAADIIVFGLSSSSPEIEKADLVNIADLKPGDSLFLLGYPGPFKTFPKGDGDSKGNRLYASHGTIVGDTFFTGDKGRLAEFSNFGYPGNSGGPLVREDGKLVGMACYTDDYDTKKQDVHTYVTTANPEVIRNWWNTLPPFPQPDFVLPSLYVK